MPNSQDGSRTKQAGKPQESYLIARDKNLTPVYLMARPLSYRQALALTRHDNEPALTQEAIIIAPIKNLPEPETMIKDILTQTINAIINESKRIEKQASKPSSKRPWSAKRTEDIIGKTTRRLFSKTIDEERLFLEILRLVREFARVRGEPYSKMGRRGEDSATTQ